MLQGFLRNHAREHFNDQRFHVVCFLDFVNRAKVMNLKQSEELPPKGGIIFPFKFLVDFLAGVHFLDDYFEKIFEGPGLAPLEYIKLFVVAVRDTPELGYVWITK